MTQKTSKILLGAAIAGIMGASALSVTATPAHAKANAKGKAVHCYGVNACAGKGACATPGLNDCSAKNSCKGKGWMSMSEKKCNKKKGTIEAPKPEGAKS